MRGTVEGQVQSGVRVVYVHSLLTVGPQRPFQYDKFVKQTSEVEVKNNKQNQRGVPKDLDLDSLKQPDPESTQSDNPG